MTSRDLDVAGCRVHVAEAGDGPPVVFLHGNPDTHDVWAPVIERLPQLYCIAPDLPGWGESRAPRDVDYSLAGQAAFVRGLADALELERFHLVVHDIGGPYGLAFATEHAARLLSLTIFNTNFFPDYQWHIWARIWRTPVLGELSMLALMRWAFVREMRRGSPNLPRAYPDHAYDDFTCRTRRAVLRWYRAADPEKLAGWDTRLLAAIADVPHQVIWGDLDPYLPAATADRFGGTVHHLPDAGHWVMQEQPEASARWIAELTGRPRT